MPRPKIPSRLNFCPEVYYFKPRGVSLRLLEEIVLLPEELEALRLVDKDGLKQEMAAEKMGVSQPTLGRILAQGREKTAKALIEGKAIRVEKRV